MAGTMSEIILCEDSEITAATAVVNEFGSPQGCGTPSLLPEAASFPQAKGGENMVQDILRIDAPGNCTHALQRLA